MTSSVYKQFLDTVGTQAKTKADAIASWFTDWTGDVLEPRKMDWQDLKNTPGLSVRWTEAARPQDSTNERDIYGYPAHLMIIVPNHMFWDQRREDIHDLKEDLREYFHHKRRLSAVSATGVNEITTTVTELNPGTAPEEMRRQYDIHGLTVWGWFLQPRAS